MSMSAAARTPRVRRVRVLLVDDVEDFRRLMRHRLEADGRFLVVGEAANGAEAVALAEEHRPDVAVIDLAMPIMDGIEAIRQIRERAPGTKAVVLSSRDPMNAAEEAVQVGAFAFLEKSTAPGQILNVLAPLAPPEFE